jgi:hypothetical protein
MGEPFPTSIKIGFTDYRIEDWGPAKAAAAHRYGECDHLARTIRVDRTHGPRMAANTLFHEVLHACWTAALLKDEDEEERIVGSLANTISAAWRDSPDVFAWISEAMANG